MIERKDYKDFTEALRNKVKGLYPVSAQLELTYRCNLDCVHCYCKNTDTGQELTTEEWKNIINQLREAGTIWITLTGGEPLLREDFPEIYNFVKDKGFLVTVFTNGIPLTDNFIDLFSEKPPHSLEITLNGITKETYEKVADVKDSFEPAMKNIEKVVSKGIPLVLKAIGLKDNKHEIHNIKSFTEDLLGEKKFKFDSFVIPKLDGDQKPCLHRLDVEDIEAIENSDPDMIKQREDEFKKHKCYLREPEFKYSCNSWFNQVYITPYGELRFCHISGKYASDLKKVSFEEGFYGVFPSILEEKHSAVTKCMTCDLREFCHICPARAMLETGAEDGFVQRYCDLALMRKRRIEESMQNKEMIQ